jgi:hypothetical protein
MKQRKIVIAVSLALSLAQQAAHAQFDAVFELSSLDGSNGFVINGVNAEDYSGSSVSKAGDINGDGIDDLIIGAFGVDINNNSYVGSSYVIFGSNSGLPHPFNLSTINALNGFVINGANDADKSGESVSQAGDINGDGIDDLIIGARFADPNGIFGAGSSYVVFGSNSGLPNPMNLADINGTNGFVINGINPGDLSGRPVSNAGDFNGDGIDDLIIGAEIAIPNGVTYAGSSYVIFGSSTGLTHPFNLSSLSSINGIAINGSNENERSGTSVSPAGDINGDGIDDLIIGARLNSPNGVIRAGSTYVVFGSDTGIPNPFNLSTINGSNGFVINGVNVNDYSGSSVSQAGDVNGDGLDDLIVGAFKADPNGNTEAGSSYVVFGSHTGFPHPFNLSTINGLNGFMINGVSTNDSSGFSVSQAGDVNGDSIDDIIIGARFASPNNKDFAGSSYVVFGNSTGLPNPFNLSTINGKNGFVINGEKVGDNSGISVSQAGDVNGDGIDDLIIGANFADPNNSDTAGSSYVVFGDDGIFNDGFE